MTKFSFLTGTASGFRLLPDRLRLLPALSRLPPAASSLRPAVRCRLIISLSVSSRIPGFLLLRLFSIEFRLIHTVIRKDADPGLARIQLDFLTVHIVIRRKRRLFPNESECRVHL